MLPFRGNSPAAVVSQVILYNLGRTLTYLIIGAIPALIGSGLNWFGWTQYFSIGFGSLLILSVLFSFSLESGFARLPGFRSLHGFIRGRLGRFLANGKGARFGLAGMLNGFLPCGLVYMAVAGAVTAGNFWQGELYMLLFGLGTIPTMFSIAWLGQTFGRKIKNSLQRAVPIIILLFGILFLLRGMNLGIPYLSPSHPQGMHSTIPCD